MKRVLITGTNSYIGEHVEEFLSKWTEEYQVDSVNMIGDDWKTRSFSDYDVIFHVAGIAHIKETKENAGLYYDVNEHLAVSVAGKAKKEGVRQFVILSSMSVYGLTVGHITKDTKPSPVSNYAKSKYNADLKIEEMNCDTFKVVILRPPMVYGKGCKGNYQTLRKFAMKSPIFPNFMNERSMIFIDNLSVFVKNIIDCEKTGLFFPQDAEYVCTSEMVGKIAEYNDKKLHLTGIFNWGIKIMLTFRIKLFAKVFGSLTYEKVDLVHDNNFSMAMKSTEEKDNGR